MLLLTLDHLLYNNMQVAANNIVNAVIRHMFVKPAISNVGNATIRMKIITLHCIILTGTPFSIFFLLLTFMECHVEYSTSERVLRRVKIEIIMNMSAKKKSIFYYFFKSLFLIISISVIALSSICAVR